MKLDMPETIMREWTDSTIMALEGDVLIREGWEIASREPIPGGVRYVFRRRKTRVEDGQ